MERLTDTPQKESEMRSICALALLMVLAVPAVAFGHGVVGDYKFLEPIIAEDANPKNEFDILAPSWYRTADGREFALGFSLEKTLAKDSEGRNLLSISLGSAWLAVSPKDRRDPYVSGFDNLEVMPKLAFYTNPKHEFRLSIATDLELPTGNPSVQEQNHTRLGPELLWAKGFGDLPNWELVKYLRPFAFQGDFGYVAALGGATYHEMFADNVIEYSLPYLSDNVKDIGLKWPLRNLYLYTEFNYDQLITGPSGQTFPTVFITPGIAFVGRYIELSVATQFALNQAAVPDNHAAVLGLLDLFIDDIVPQVNWTPF